MPLLTLYSKTKNKDDIKNAIASVPLGPEIVARRI